MEQESVSYPEALKIVGKKYGIEVQLREQTEEEVRRNDDRESMMILNSWAAEYFQNNLNRDEKANGARQYLAKRNFTVATIKKFGIGFCPERGQFSKDALAAGYKQEFLVATGLCGERDDKTLYDRFFGRVIFPIHTVSGRVTAFGGRTMSTEKKVAKYVNSPESEVYSKKNVLYGLFFAKKAIQQQDFAIMVEGYADVISMHQKGVENVVSSSGTSLTVEQIQLIKRFTKNLTLIYDGDAAGIHAAMRGVDMILSEGMNVRVVVLPPEHDPDSFAQAHTLEALQQYISENQKDFITFKAETLLGEAQNDPIKRASLISDIVNSISQIPDPIPRAVYTKDCSLLMQIDDQVFIAEVAKKRLSYSTDKQTTEFIRNQQRIERERQQQVDVKFGEGVALGSGMKTLEAELSKYLLKYGHRNFEFREGGEYISLNVASLIISELETNGFEFQTPIYYQISKTYIEQYDSLGEGEQVPESIFINHSDPDVCSATVDLLTSDDNYKISALWQRHDVVVDSEEERLAEAVPRAIILYKYKAIDEILNKMREQMSDDDDIDLQQMMQFDALNRERTSISKRLERLVP